MIETPKTNHQPWWVVFDGFNLPPWPSVPPGEQGVGSSERILEQKIKDQKTEGQKADIKTGQGCQIQIQIWILSN